MNKLVFGEIQGQREFVVSLQPFSNKSQNLPQKKSITSSDMCCLAKFTLKYLLAAWLHKFVYLQILFEIVNTTIQ